MAFTLTKKERLSSKKDIARLMKSGRWGVCGAIKYCILQDTGENVDRIMVSVPKKFFKRAVKRNLLKRRIRESYRLQKDLLTSDGKGIDIMFQYNSPDILSFEEIKSLTAQILAAASAK